MVSLFAEEWCWIEWHSVSTEPALNATLDCWMLRDGGRGSCPWKWKLPPGFHIGTFSIDCHLVNLRGVWITPRCENARRGQIGDRLMTIYPSSIYIRRLGECWTPYGIHIGVTNPIFSLAHPLFDFRIFPLKAKLMYCSTIYASATLLQAME